MKRLMRNHLWLLLPSRLRAWIKRRYLLHHPVMEIPENPNLTITRETGCLVVDAGEGFSLKILSAADADLNEYAADLRHNPDFAVFLNYIPTKGVFYDIGSHRGFFATAFCARSPENQAWAFEPSPRYAKTIRRAVELNNLSTRLRVIEAGVGEKPGRVPMLIDPVSEFIVERAFHDNYHGEPKEVLVEIISVDAAVDRWGIVPSLIKIDVEGYEYEVIEGAVQTLRRNRPLLFVELHLKFLEERGHDPVHLVTRLSDCGYRFKSLAGKPLRPANLYDFPGARLHFIAE